VLSKALVIPPGNVIIRVEDLDEEDVVEEEEHDPVERERELVCEDRPLVRHVGFVKHRDLVVSIR